MTDREMLELAAKAAGELHLIPYRAEWLDSCEAWNPLADDGDALRLAVRLDINVTFSRKHVTACADSHAGVGISQHEKDRNIATRRAIVCAAAEVGKAMQ